MPQYKICECPHCGTVQLSTAEKSLKCIRCGKSRGFSSKLGVNVIKVFDDFRMAHAFISEYKRLKGFS
jgi:transcription elongation factor Elf1